MPPKYLQLYKDVVTAVAEVNGAINRSPTPEQVIQMDGDILQNLTDAIYAVRESYDLLDEARKTVNNLHRELQGAACTAYLSATPEQVFAMTESGRTKGEYATGKPGTKVTVEQMKRDKSPELYDRFCREVLGVTNDSLIESGAIEVHYKYFGEWVTNELAEGRMTQDIFKQVKTYNELQYKVIKTKALLT